MGNFSSFLQSLNIINTKFSFQFYFNRNNSHRFEIFRKGLDESKVKLRSCFAKKLILFEIERETFKYYLNLIFNFISPVPKNNRNFSIRRRKLNFLTPLLPHSVESAILIRTPRSFRIDKTSLSPR